MKKILVPTDFSKPAQLALDVAIGVAQRAQGEIILLHVVEKPVGFIHYPTIPDQIKRDNLYLSAFVAEKKLDLVKTSKTLKEMDVSVKWKVVSGRPYHEILQTISELKIDLVVIGALGESDVPELALGSTAERIVRFSPSPVLTVHERPSCTHFAKIVYASSLDENEKYFAEVVKSTQGLYEAVIHLVRIDGKRGLSPGFR